MNKRILRTVVITGMAIAVSESVALGAGLLRASSASAWMRRLILKGSDAAADELARRAIAGGAAHEKYELLTTANRYWDYFAGAHRGAAWPMTYRSMWLDPVTSIQHFETYVSGVLRDRYPFHYTPHNRSYSCQSTGDPGNGYHYSVYAGVRYWVINRVVQSSPGQEVFFPRVTYEFGMTTLPANCFNPPPSHSLAEQRNTMVARAGKVDCTPGINNVDVDYLITWYAQ